jgi:hypothetical protein
MRAGSALDRLRGRNVQVPEGNGARTFFRKRASKLSNGMFMRNRQRRATGGVFRAASSFPTSVCSAPEKKNASWRGRSRRKSALTLENAFCPASADVISKKNPRVVPSFARLARRTNSASRSRSRLFQSMTGSARATDASRCASRRPSTTICSGSGALPSALDVPVSGAPRSRSQLLTVWAAGTVGDHRARAAWRASSCLSLAERLLVRAAAARRAICWRCSTLRASARALPPLAPPRRPRATA